MLRIGKPLDLWLEYQVLKDSEFDIEVCDGYEAISIEDGKVIYTNVEPVKVDGLL